MHKHDLLPRSGLTRKAGSETTIAVISLLQAFLPFPTTDSPTWPLAPASWARAEAVARHTARSSHALPGLLWKGKRPQRGRAVLAPQGADRPLTFSCAVPSTRAAHSSSQPLLGLPGPESDCTAGKGRERKGAGIPCNHREFQLSRLIETNWTTLPTLTKQEALQQVVLLIYKCFFPSLGLQLEVSVLIQAHRHTGSALHGKGI